jgi:hypothetical protein
MIPKREEYFAFLKTAIERLTISSPYTSGYHVTNFTGVMGPAFERKHPVKIDFKQL